MTMSHDTGEWTVLCNGCDAWATTPSVSESPDGWHSLKIELPPEEGDGESERLWTEHFCPECIRAGKHLNRLEQIREDQKGALDGR